LDHHACSELPPDNFVKHRPNHVIAFIRPKRHTQPANLANFLVPLSFNKLDLRDYLWHAYGVRVTSVRSMVQQQPLQKKGPVELAGGHIFRPAAKKMMLAQLESPFVWPERVKPEDLPEEYDYERHRAQEEFKKGQMREAAILQDGQIELLTEREKDVRGRDAMREEARKLLAGETEWKNEVRLDERWDALLGDVGARTKKSRG
jgi:large subunit ribosomal protein L23